MTISLSDLGKRFNYDWIFRHLSYQFESNQVVAIIGSNGSGKSTLLQIIGGALFHNEGTVNYTDNQGAKLADESIFKQVSFCAPYLELIEEMTGLEFLNFHERFKPFIPGVDAKTVLQKIQLEQAAQKQIRYYSSGMKQRLKLGQCLFSDTSVVLLDEPCTNLDITGIEMYQSLVEQLKKDRVVIIASNDPVEYKQSNHELNISYYSSLANSNQYTSN
ncbi:MAG: ATP-binding cassette domain-containing protein [Chitinophagaceae bacterium]|nr:ATP-binding cassette domain-containing protein [Chitinophagaceae bacterium]